ncbi:glycosyltransferase [Paenibacillus sp. GD4]|jgi:glycosyltransferase involved in cell wall biosynthesis|uniref:glycosyltransferase family 2 protein n=1 Tax=Paenibacillus sp. GD4 TaxID=3068890 RepID=UPI0027966947|nr:glycosyltransferase family 2 protein [Paenibacillus sp. GD4]MDQ1911345.1 glycosyltransferase [Paenibacillus sp. GD4]
MTRNRMHDRKLAEQHYGAIIRALQEKRFEEAEEQALGEISKAPLIPQAWVLLGEALLHQGFGSAARKVFHRAWLLDPEAEWITAVEQAVRQAPAGQDRADINQLLQVKKVTVTIGIIARNEERSIARCLESLKGAADEIILVDCESTDRTAEIAGSFPGVRIVHATWEQDFSALRNKGLAHMKTDWVLWVDADEALHPEDVDAVREAAGLFDDFPIPPVLYIWQVNSINGSVRHEMSQTRMFPLRYGLKYYGRVHEQVGSGSGGIFSGQSYRKPVRIRLLHDGYEPTVIQAKDKLARNLSLLRIMVEEEPDNPGWWLFYGRESLSAGLPEQAEEALRKAEALGKDNSAFARMLDVYMLQAKLYLGKREWDLAEGAALRALELHPQFPDAKFYLAATKLHRGYALFHEAEGLLRQAKADFAHYRGTVTPDHEIAKWKADVSLADIARSVGKFGDAAQIYRSVAERYPYAAELQKPLRLIEEQRQKL